VTGELLKRQRKGQVALEYLITYGWAFLVILAIVGVLGYFGLLNPSKYIPESCEFGEQLKCVDYSIQKKSSPYSSIDFRFRNNFGEAINITDVYGPDLILQSDDNIIPSGEVKKISLQANSVETWSIGSKQRFDFVIEFKRSGGTTQYNVSGSVFAEVIDGDIFS
jgi:hypothetical protein